MTQQRTDPAGNKHQRHKKTDGSIQERKIRTSKHRYVYFIGNKKQKKQMLAELNYEILPYPKGKSKRYDAGYKPEVQLELF